MTLKVEVNIDDIRDLRQMVLLLFGNPRIPRHQWDQDLINCAYKFYSNFIEIDEKTIKLDEKGRLFVDNEELRESIRDWLKGNDFFNEEMANRVQRLVLENEIFNKTLDGMVRQKVHEILSDYEPLFTCQICGELARRNDSPPHEDPSSGVFCQFECPNGHRFWVRQR